MVEKEEEAAASEGKPKAAGRNEISQRNMVILRFEQMESDDEDGVEG